MPTDKNPGRKVLAPFSEGHMDVKYLATRYEKGVTKVAELMSEQQRYVHLGNLQDALPDFISFASKLSLPDTCLWLSLRRKGFVFLPCCAKADHCNPGCNSLATEHRGCLMRTTLGHGDKN